MSFWSKLDNLVPYERGKHILVTLALLGLCVFIGCSVWLTSEATLTLRTFRQSTLKDADYKERLAGVLSRAQEDLVKIGLLVDEGTVTVKDARLRFNSSLATLNLDLQALSPLADEFRGLVADSRKGLGKNLDELLATQKGVTSIVTAAKEPVEKSLSNFASASFHLDSGMARIEQVIYSPETERRITSLLDHGENVFANLDLSTLDVTLMTGDGTVITSQAASVATDLGSYVHGTFNPGPQPWWKKFILVPLKSSLGYGLSAYQIFKK